MAAIRIRYAADELIREIIMPKTINHILNRILDIVIGTCVGVFIGYGIFVFWDYKTHPGLYAMQSAPWYTGILFYGIATVVVLIVLIMIKLMIRICNKH